MSRARETTLTFRYVLISPGAESLCSKKMIFFTYASCSFFGVKFDFIFTYADRSFSGWASSLYLPVTTSVTIISFYKNCIFGQAFHGKIMFFKIAMSERRPRFTFWLTLFQRDRLPLFFLGKPFP